MPLRFKMKLLQIYRKLRLDWLQISCNFLQHLKQINSNIKAFLYYHNYITLYRFIAQL